MFTNWLRRFYKIIILIVLALAFYGIAYLTPDVSEMREGKIKILRPDFKTGLPVSVEVGPKTSDWTPIGKVSRFFLNAIVVAEDSRFYQHFGLDFREIWNSVQINLELGRYARGGSTITQQVVRILFLSREKTLLRKVCEILGALVLEWTMSKDEILEWYVNLVPLGKSNYGVKQASRFFFDTDPELLNIMQSIQLAMIIPAPSIWAPGLVRKKMSLAAQKRFANVANALFSEGYITLVQHKKALASGNFGAPIAND